MVVRRSPSEQPVLPAGDVTFVFTDVEGSTALLQQVGEDRYIEILDEVRGIQVRAASSAGGRLVNTEGDGCFFAFSDPAVALGASAAMQEGLTAWGRMSDKPVRVRMGMHRGRNIRPIGNDYTSLSVHHAARVAAAANGGQVLCTEPVAAAAPDLCRDLGLFVIRDFDAPVRLFALHPGTQSSRRAPRATRFGTRSFPIYRTSYVGRQDDIERVTKAIGASRLVTLLGPGGAGKTRLAVETVCDPSSSAVRWFVDLAAATGRAEIVDALRAALGDLGPDVPDDPIEAVTKLLGDTPAIAVVDNCEHLIDETASFVDELLSRVGSVTVLCTSREPLALPDEYLVHVAGLSLPVEDSAVAVMSSDAGRLLVERAEWTAPVDLAGPDLDEVVSIVRAVDGLPLAIELLAGALSTAPLVAWRTILQNEFDRSGSSTPVARGRPARHLSLHAVIEWSVHSLPIASRRSLAALALATSPVAPRTVRAALGAAGVDETQISLILDDLLRRSLLADGGAGTIRMLETIRTFAQELPEAADLRTEVLDALVADCMDAAGVWRLSFDTDSPDFDPVAPTACALIFDPRLTSVRRQELARAFAPWYSRLGPRRYGAYLATALDLDDSNDAVVVRLLQAAAVNASALGDLDLAEVLLFESLRRSSDPDDEGQAFAVAVVRIRQSRYEEALDVVEPRCPSLHEEPTSPWLQLRAIALGEQGRFDEAEPFYAAAAPTAPETPAQVMALQNLANVQAHRGNSAAAIQNAVTVLARTSSRIVQTMAVHAIALAAASETMTVDVLALLIWHHDDLQTLGWTLFPGERTGWEETLSRAASELTKSQLDEADAWAAQLDVAAALDLAVEVANRFVAPVSNRRPRV